MEIVSFIIAIISVIAAVASIIFSMITYHHTVVHNRKQATLDAYNRLQTEVFDYINTYSPSQICEILENPRSEKYKIISGYLARIEHFCVGLNQKIYDTETFYALAHGYFDGHQLRKRIEPLIESKNRDNNGTETYYNDTISVLEWMRSRSKNKRASNK